MFKRLFIIIIFLFFLNSCSVQKQNSMGNLEYVLFHLDKQKYIGKLSHNSTNDILYYFFDLYSIRILESSVLIMDYEDRIIFNEVLTQDEIDQIHNYVIFRINKNN